MKKYQKNIDFEGFLARRFSMRRIGRGRRGRRMGRRPRQRQEGVAEGRRYRVRILTGRTRGSTGARRDLVGPVGWVGIVQAVGLWSTNHSGGGGRVFRADGKKGFWQIWTPNLHYGVVLGPKRPKKSPCPWTRKKKPQPTPMPRT